MISEHYMFTYLGGWVWIRERLSCHDGRQTGDVLRHPRSSACCRDWWLSFFPPSPLCQLPCNHHAFHPWPSPSCWRAHVCAADCQSRPPAFILSVRAHTPLKRTGWHERDPTFGALVLIGPQPSASEECFCSFTVYHSSTFWSCASSRRWDACVYLVRVTWRLSQAGF